MTQRTRVTHAGGFALLRVDHVAPAVIALVAVTARILAQLALGFYERPETWEEGEIALRILSGQGYSYEILGTTAFALRGPPYAFMLAAAYALFGATPLVAGAFQAVLGGRWPWRRTHLRESSGSGVAHLWRPRSSHSTPASSRTPPRSISSTWMPSL